MTDPIADMIVRVMNGMRVNKETVDVPHSRFKEEMARILLSEGFIARSEILARMNKKFMRLSLKYNEKKKGIIAGFKKISKPGRRVYVEARKVPRVQAGFGIAVISTPQGLMTDDQARGKKLGGEVICYIW